MTAMSKRRPKQMPERASHAYQEEILATNRIVRVFKGGRRFRVRVLVVLGDQDGTVGIGLAKGVDIMTAKTKAVNVAQKSMFKVAINETTVPHRVDAKVSGSKIMIKPARQGDGLIAGSVVRTILEKAGYSDVYSKSLGGSNKINLAYAVVKALKQLVPRDQWIDFPGSNIKAKETDDQTKADDRDSGKDEPSDKQVSKTKIAKVKTGSTKTKTAKVKEDN